MTDVDLWVDPACPWAWITSRWLLEVERVRPVKVRFHVMSLAVLNAKPVESTLWWPVRVLLVAGQKYGEHVVRPLYGAMGTRVHHGAQGLGADMIKGALADIGLDPRLAAEAESLEHDDELRVSHETGMRPVGHEVGTPVIHVPTPNGPPIAFFGPVITPIPRGAEAGKLWDGVLLVAGTDGFFELKRSRDRSPSFD